MSKLEKLMEALRSGDRIDLDEAKSVRGKAQKAVMRALQHGEIELTDMARNPEFRGIHFAQIMKSVEALARSGHVNFNPKTQVISLLKAVKK